MKNILPQDGTVIAWESFLNEGDSQAIFDLCKINLNWQQNEINLFGKKHLVPRLECFLAKDSTINYSYSGKKLINNTVPDFLLPLWEKIEDKTNTHFNCLLANYYLNGNHSMGFHSDDEKELGKNPSIASLSLGAERKFVLKHKKLELKQETILTNGCLLLMKEKTQHYWKHGIPKTAKKIDGRINLTFRYINPSL